MSTNNEKGKKKLKLKPHIKVVLAVILLILIYNVVKMFFVPPKEIVYTDYYLGSSKPTGTVILDFETNELDTLIRGTKVIGVDSPTLIDEKEYQEITYSKDGNEVTAFVSSEYLVTNKNDVVMEEELYVLYATHLRDSIYGGLEELVQYGDVLQVNGGDIEEDGTVLWYSVDVNGEERFILNKYISVEKPENREVNTLVNEKYQSIDYITQPKNNYENNPRPEEVKAIYVGFNAIGRIDKYIELAKESEINAFVIDFKDSTGDTLMPVPGIEEYVNDQGDRYSLEYVRELIQKCIDNDIYIIARIVAFRGNDDFLDTHPESTVTYIETGEPYLYQDDPFASGHDRTAWEYNLLISEYVADLGVNEIQFDYVRFSEYLREGTHNIPTDYEGETRPETITRFLQFAFDQLSRKEVYLSADLFPDIMRSTVTVDRIGQYLPAVLSTVDYVSLMVYPDLYGQYYFDGIKYSDANPYEVLYQSTLESLPYLEMVESPADYRPWIKAYTAKWVAGWITYGPDELQAEIDGLNDAGVYDYMIWNSAGNYSQVSEALLK